MADTVKSLKTVESKSSFDHQPSEAFETEIATLRSEIASLRDLIADKTGVVYDKVSSQASQAVNRASDVASRASDAASNAANYVSDEASSVATTIREHPAATTTLFTLIGAVGFAVGYVVATASADSKQAWYSRYLNDRF